MGIGSLTSKKGTRALGIAESYSGREQSVLCGVSMRKDGNIDGIRFVSVSVGGLDATHAVISLIQDFERRDINIILLGGCIISWFNIIDTRRVNEATGIPVICVTYENSDGLLTDIRRHFPDDEYRLSLYRGLGDRIPVYLETGKTIYIRPFGIPERDAATICDQFTLDGRIPEPIRVARLAARGLMRYEHGSRPVLL
ncbi:MAG TPA: DUF99 family protein [Methanoregulaceae archaeon]|nr:DUF99 family protein [Methanoregulaceae archaeon]